MERQTNGDRRMGERRSAGERRARNRRVSASLFVAMERAMESVKTSDMNDSMQERRADERRGGEAAAGHPGGLTGSRPTCPGPASECGQACGGGGVRIRSMVEALLIALLIVVALATGVLSLVAARRLTKG